MRDDLFRNRLENLIDRRHGLARLAEQLPWDALCAAVEACATQRLPTPGRSKGAGFFGEIVIAGGVSNAGQPPLPSRLLIGLHYLKHAYDCSDEEVVERWSENPYWQYFTGETYFQTRRPCDGSSLTRWRGRVGEAGVEEMLTATIAAACDIGLIRRVDCEKLIIDTTVQEKAIAHPTDSRLLDKARERLVREAELCGLTLRQNYNRVAPALCWQASRYAHARQGKRLRRTVKKLRTLTGRVMRDIERQSAAIPEARRPQWEVLLVQTRRLLAQKPKDKNKLYALHAPEVECISKGKARRPYEFGVKVGIAVTHKQGFIVGARSFPGNPYDGDTLAEQLEQAEILTTVAAQTVVVDLGYRGREIPGVTLLHRGKRRRLTPKQRRDLKRRPAVEPTIGHLKEDCRMRRNWLKGAIGDALHAVLCACGYNLRRLIRHLAVLYAYIAAVFAIFIGRPVCTASP